MAQETHYSKPVGHWLIQKLGLHESTLGYARGAEKQYRDSKGTNSIHAREFATRFCVHQDQYNPEYYPVDHFLVDVLKPEAVIAGTLTFLLVLAASRNVKTSLILGTGMGAVVQLIADNEDYAE